MQVYEEGSGSPIAGGAGRFPPSDTTTFVSAPIGPLAFKQTQEKRKRGRWSRVGDAAGIDTTELRGLFAMKSSAPAAMGFNSETSGVAVGSGFASERPAVHLREFRFHCADPAIQTCGFNTIFRASAFFASSSMAEIMAGDNGKSELEPSAGCAMSLAGY